jgi:hypothetical protein
LILVGQLRAIAMDQGFRMKTASYAPSFSRTTSCFIDVQALTTLSVRLNRWLAFAKTFVPMFMLTSCTEGATKEYKMHPKDAFGVDINVGNKIVHSRQGRSHRHSLRVGIVADVSVVENVRYAGSRYESRVLTGTVRYVTPDGHVHRAKRFDMIAVVG